MSCTSRPEEVTHAVGEEDACAPRSKSPSTLAAKDAEATSPATSMRAAASWMARYRCPGRTMRDRRALRFRTTW